MMRVVPSLVKNRVLIRPLEPGDCAAFISAARRSRTLHARWISRRPSTPEAFADYLKRFATGERYGFLVVERESGTLVGMINLNHVIRGAFQNASLGYYAFVPNAGKGLMGEGMRLALRHAFGTLKLHRLEANIQPENHASIQLARRSGFVFEGLSRHLLKIGGRWRDHERWVMLAEDFRRRPA